MSSGSRSTARRRDALILALCCTTAALAAPPLAAQPAAHDARDAEQMGSPMEQEFGVQSYTDLVLLSPEEMLARWLEAQDPGRNVPRVLAGRADSAALRNGAMLPTIQPWRRVIGSVLENDTTVQVLYRSFTVAGGSFMGPDGISVLTMRRTPAGWRIWAGWQDGYGLSTMIGFASGGTGAAGGMQQLLDSAAKVVVTWPASDPAGVAPGRAFVDGYAGGLGAPRAIVVESTHPDGTQSRVEIPPSAFRTLSELLAPWPVAPDSSAAGPPSTPAPTRKP
jgi:hypothetical protein